MPFGYWCTISVYAEIGDVVQVILIIYTFANLIKPFTFNGYGLERSAKIELSNSIFDELLFKRENNLLMQSRARHIIWFPYKMCRS